MISIKHIWDLDKKLIYAKPGGAFNNACTILPCSRLQLKLKVTDSAGNPSWTLPDALLDMHYATICVMSGRIALHDKHTAEFALYKKYFPEIFVSANDHNIKIRYQLFSDNEKRRYLVIRCFGTEGNLTTFMAKHGSYLDTFKDIINLRRKDVDNGMMINLTAYKKVDRAFYSLSKFFQHELVLSSTNSPCALGLYSKMSGPWALADSRGDAGYLYKFKNLDDKLLCAILTP
jgi:hypothetical protein